MSGTPDGLIACVGLTFSQVLKAILHVLNGLAVSSNNSREYCPVRLDLYLVLSYELMSTTFSLFILVSMGYIPGAEEFIRKQLTMQQFFGAMYTLCILLFLQAQLPLVMVIGVQITCHLSATVKVYFWIIAGISQVFAIGVICFTVATWSSRKEHRDFKLLQFKTSISSKHNVICDAITNFNSTELLRQTYDEFNREELECDHTLTFVIKHYFCIKLTFERYKRVRHSQVFCAFCDSSIADTEQNGHLFVCQYSKHVLHWECFAKASGKSFNYCPACLDEHSDRGQLPTQEANLLWWVLSQQAKAPEIQNRQNAVPVRLEQTADKTLPFLQEWRPQSVSEEAQE